MKPEYFDLQEFVYNQNLVSFLKEIPHILKDSFGNVISQSQNDKLSQTQELPVVLGENTFAKLTTSLEKPEFLLKVLSSHIELKLKNSNNEQVLLQEELVLRDLHSLFVFFENNTLENTILKLLKHLQSHILCEFVYASKDIQGSSVPIVGIDQQNNYNNENWPFGVDSTDGIVINSLKPYLCNDTSKDPSLSGVSKNIEFKKILTVPLVNKGSVVGIIQLRNKLDDFNEFDVEIAQKFSFLASHFIQVTTQKEMIQSLEKENVKLSNYVSKDIKKSLQENEKNDLGGTEKRIVVLFSDIRSFTTITEGISASNFVNLLNFYFEEMNKCIDKYNGTFDKIVGDLVMAWWTEDKAEPEHSAIKCAFEMQKSLRLNVAPVWNSKGVPHFGIGIGLNCGQAVVGNLGCSKFKNFTAIGDTINTAQRLESKAGPGEVWLSESIMKVMQGKITNPDRIEKNIQLKGKQKTQNAFVYIPKV